MVLGHGGSLPSAAVVTLGNGTATGIFVLSDGNGTVNQTVASLTTSGTGSNAVVGGTASGNSILTINNSSADTFAGMIGGTGTSVMGNTVNENLLAITKSGAGMLTLSGASNYTGGTTFAGGTLNVASLGSISTSGNLSFTGGTLQYSSVNTTDYSSKIANSSSSISIDTNSQNITYASALVASNSGGLTKLGAGTLKLAVANTYGARPPSAAARSPPAARLPARR